MSCKVLTRDVISIDAFIQSPEQALNQTETGMTAVFCDNTPLFYAVTPARMAQLLAMEQQSAISEPGVLYEIASRGKFAMYPQWKPDSEFQRMAALWGVQLTRPVTSAELQTFISYWQAEGKMFHHVQWQQKLARSVQLNRNGTVRRDITASSLPDEHIPAGFKG